MICSWPATISDGVVTYPGLPLLMDNATHECDPGFDLIGSHSRTCTALGPGLVDWYPAVPSCSSKTY